MKTVIYEPEKHKYFVNNTEVPSVNQILQAEGAIPSFPQSAEYNRQLGTYGHQLIQLYFENNLDAASICKDLQPYYRGFQKFLQEINFTDPLVVEKPLYSEQWNFAGTVDCIWGDILIDWKFSPHIYPHYLLTTGGYSILYEEFLGYKPKEVWLVSILPDNYKLSRIEPDRKTFLAFLIVYQWKQRIRR